jgi:hypothetical protein
MKKLFWIYLLALLLGCTTGETQQEQTDAPTSDPVASSPEASSATAQPVAYSQLQGIWVNTSFGRTLETTRSPRQAATDVPTISFFEEDGQRVVFVNLAFREGITVPVANLQQDGGSLKNEEFEINLNADQSQLTLRLAGDLRKKGAITFRRLTKARLNSLDEEHDAVLAYLNKAVLAGTYRDKQGNTYQFTPDMKAILPEASFTYEFGMGGVFSDCDGIYAVEGGAGRQSLGFGWKGQTLQLFRTSPDPDNPDGLVCEGQPFAELTRDDTL